MKDFDFSIGSNYFMFSGLDVNSNCPVIKSLVYLGINIEEVDNSEGDVWFFQDSDSYKKFKPYDKSYVPNKENIACDIYYYTLDNIHAIENFDQLVNSLGNYGYDSNGVISLLRK